MLCVMFSPEIIDFVFPRTALGILEHILVVLRIIALDIRPTIKPDSKSAIAISMDMLGMIAFKSLF